MPKANTELVESLHQFITIWKLIGKPFPQVDRTDRPGLAISWPNTHFPFYNSLFLTEQLTESHALRDNPDHFSDRRSRRGVRTGRDGQASAAAGNIGSQIGPCKTSGTCKMG
jgi:hypothetical protein